MILGTLRAKFYYSIFKPAVRLIQLVLLGCLQCLLVLMACDEKTI